MAVTLLSGTQFATNTTSVNFVNGNGAVCLLCFQYAADNTTPPTFNGVSFTYLQQVGSDYGGPVFAWYMYNPPDGTHVFTPSGFTEANIYAFSGVDASIYDNIQVNGQNINISGSTNDGYFAFFQQAASGSGAINWTSGQTNKLGVGLGGSALYPGSTSTYTSTVTYGPNLGGNQSFAISIVPVIPIIASFADTFTIVENVILPQFVNYSEVFNIRENFTDGTSYQTTVSDTFVIAETFTHSLTTPIWTSRTKPTTSWGTRNKPTTIWLPR